MPPRIDCLQGVEEEGWREGRRPVFPPPPPLLPPSPRGEEEEEEVEEAEEEVEEGGPPLLPRGATASSRKRARKSWRAGISRTNASTTPDSDASAEATLDVDDVELVEDVELELDVEDREFRRRALAMPPGRALVDGEGGDVSSLFHRR